MLKTLELLISWIVDSFKDSRKKKERRIRKRKVSSLSAQKIFNDFKNQPKKHKYKGYKVYWHCEFVKLETSSIINQIYLKCDGINIRTKVSLNDYPELRNENKGEKYNITGIIEKIEKDGIYLNKLIKLEKDTFFVF